MEQTYRIAVARKFGAPEQIVIEEHPINPLAGSAVRVAVRAAGQNPVDARRRAGSFGGQVPMVFGTEFSGVVHESNDNRWVVGDEVIGWSAAGAVADLVDTVGDRLARKPAAMPWAVAGGISGAGQSAIAAFNALNLAPGALILVHGAAGGVGSALVQLGLAKGYSVIGTASQSNQQYLRELGAAPVLYGRGLAARIQEATGGNPIAASIDLAGTSEAGDIALSLRSRGAQVITLVPETWKSHDLELVSSRPNGSQFAQLADAYAKGKLNLAVNTLPFTQVVQAHQSMDAKHSRGKLVLENSDNPYLASAQR